MMSSMKTSTALCWMTMNELYQSIILVTTSALIVFVLFLSAIILQAESQMKRTNRRVQKLLDDYKEPDDKHSNVLIYTRKGRVKNVKVFKKALSIPEISGLYTKGWNTDDFLTEKTLETKKIRLILYQLPLILPEQ